MATFVLVHGSWAGGVVWRELAPRLRKAGHEVYAPTLTGIGARKHLLNREIDLDTHIQDVIGVIDDADLSDIVLVGHSYGGMVITGVADRVPEKIASLVYLDAFVPENGQSLFSVLPSDRRLTTVPGEDWLVAPIPPAGFGLKRPEVIALWQGKSAPHPLATLTQPVQLTGDISGVKKKMYILATDPARFTQFYEKLKNDPAWTVHTLPCTHFIQLEMPDELTAILLKAIPWRSCMCKSPLAVRRQAVAHTALCISPWRAGFSRCRVRPLPAGEHA
jgi:pimeloyl-ACP methyl ester carboxylesterase